MTKKIKIVLLVIALIVVIAVVALWYRQMGIQQKIVSSVFIPINGQVVGDKIAETNPFKVEITPYDAYKNPFKK